jgi:ABC-type phosphate transport system substrate-binding protein
MNQKLVLALALMLALTTPPAPGYATPPADTDTVVVVVSAASAVTEISRLHLADLYMGRTTRYPNGSPAVPIDQRTGSPVRAAFSATYLGRSEAQMKAHWSRIIFTGRGRPPTEASSDDAVRDLIAGDPRAIGYIDPRRVNSKVRVVRVL